MKDQICSLLEELEAMRKRPKMYVGSVDPERVKVFLIGFEIASEQFGVKVPRDFMAQIQQDRGWPKMWPARGEVFYWKAHGLNDAEIVDELLAIEIEVFKRVLEMTPDEAAS